MKRIQPIMAFLMVCLLGLACGCGGATVQLQPEQMLAQLEGQKKR